MLINIRAKNFSVEPRLQEYAERKLNNLTRYLPNIDRVDLELAQERRKKEGERTTAQITVRLTRGPVMRVVDDSQPESYAAIDVAIEKIKTQIERFKGKRRKRGGERFAEMYPDLATAEVLPGEEVAEDEPVSIVRRKEVEMIPMSELEAIEQMEMLGHDFFVFFNIENKQVNVLYRRHAGDLGLIAPIIGR
jgi:putative sigma-54 modulation protein